METKKDKRFLLIAFPLAGILFFIIASYLYFLPELRFQQAETAFASGEYEKASKLIEKEKSERTALLQDRIRLEQAKESLKAGDKELTLKLLENLPETDAVLELKRQMAYDEALEVFTAGDWTQAIDLLQSLKGYKDSYILIDRARAEIAEEHFRQGQGAKAVEELLSLGTEETTARAYEIAIEVTGIEDPDEALTTIRGLDAETIQHRKLLRERQKEAETTILATGFDHTVGLRKNGTVLACGDNTTGQCEVEDWTDVTEVAAGAYHTVGLKADGTVVATGDNTYGQCNVSEWKEIIHIAANNYDTIALTRGGQVLHTGYHQYTDMEFWPSDVVAVSAGSYAAAGLRKGGQLLTTHVSNDAPEFSGLIFCAVQTGYSVGLTENGTPVAHGVVLPKEWEEGIISLSCATNRILALTAEGTVLEYVFLARDALLPEPISGITAVASGATHIALMRNDGTVVCFGSNQFGECSTEDWNLLEE